MRRGAILAAAFALAATAGSEGSGGLDAAERAYAAWRTLADRVELTAARNAESDLDGTPRPRLEQQRDTARERAAAAVARLVAGDARGPESQRALALVREGLGSDSAEPKGEDAAARETLYAAFGTAAATLPFESGTLDRLTILGRLAREPDRERRRQLFFALAPLWRAVNGDGGADSPYRRLLPASARAWREQGSPADRGVRALGVDPDGGSGAEERPFATEPPRARASGSAWREPPDGGSGAEERPFATEPPRARASGSAWREPPDGGSGAEERPFATEPPRARASGSAWREPPDVMEGWLVRLLEAWRDHGAVAGEPWDYWHAAGGTSRELSAAVPRERLRAINDAYHASLGAAPEAIGLRYDLDPRPGKTPVAFTTYGSREHAEAWVFATYAEGGFDNLIELLHETGHGLHVLATFAMRPAFRDWPDADPFTEGVGDLLAHEAYEVQWQRRWLGASVAPRDALRAKYAGVVLDVAWALFEIRLHRDPDADPNVVWTAITSEYLKIAPHPELSWWALRGQLVESPGYMANYAAGAFVTAALRERVRAARGPTAMTGGDAGLYAWLARDLLRFGRARPTAEVLAEFLGGPLGPEPLLRDLARARD